MRVAEAAAAVVGEAGRRRALKQARRSAERRQVHLGRHAAAGRRRFPGPREPVAAKIKAYQAGSAERDGAMGHVVDAAWAAGTRVVGPRPSSRAA